MTRSRRTASVLTAAALMLGMFGGAASAQQPPTVSQVVCLATGWVDAPKGGPDPLMHWLDERTGEIHVAGEGTCVKPEVAPGDAVVFDLAFSGSGQSTRTGPGCLAGVIFEQEIDVTLTLTPADPPGPAGATRTVHQVWTTELNVGSPVADVPSVYPATHFQIRQPNARYSLRGAGAYTEPIGPDCPHKPQSSLPSVFAFTFTGADAQP